MKQISLLGVSALLLTACSGPGYSQLKIGLEDYASGFTRPVDITNADDDRLFIVEQPGRIRIVQGKNNVLAGHFLDMRPKVKSTGSEQGLLGLAFHPDYSTNGYFFVNYTGPGDTTHISRFSVSSGDANKADSLSEVRVLSIPQPYTNHNGGCIKFGPDGMLYIGMGDGGSGGDPNNYAQNKNELLGKMLRIDVDNLPYTIPSTNPLFSQSGVKKEIWAVGLRNPWRFSFDRTTGDLWIADVGQNSWEEVNMQPANSTGGENYGWRCYEGPNTYNTTGCGPAPTYTGPVGFYPNTGFNGDCSVTGGFRYRGTKYSGMESVYFMGDYCSTKLWTIHDSSGTWKTTFLGDFGSANFSTFGEDDEGEIYVAGLSNGFIYHLIDSATIPGVAVKKATSAISVFPNPFREFVTVEVDNPSSGKMIAILATTEGKEVGRYEVKRGRNTIDLSSLIKGIYLLRMEGIKNGGEFRLIKE